MVEGVYKCGRPGVGIGGRRRGNIPQEFGRFSGGGVSQRSGGRLASAVWGRGRGKATTVVPFADHHPTPHTVVVGVVFRAVVWVGLAPTHQRAIAEYRAFPSTPPHCCSQCLVVFGLGL